MVFLYASLEVGALTSTPTWSTVWQHGLSFSPNEALWPSFCPDLGPAGHPTNNQYQHSVLESGCAEEPKQSVKTQTCLRRQVPLRIGTPALLPCPAATWYPISIKWTVLLTKYMQSDVKKFGSFLNQDFVLCFWIFLIEMHLYPGWEKYINFPGFKNPITRKKIYNLATRRLKAKSMHMWKVILVGHACQWRDVRKMRVPTCRAPCICDFTAKKTKLDSYLVFLLGTIFARFFVHQDKTDIVVVVGSVRSLPRVPTLFFAHDDQSTPSRRRSQQIDSQLIAGQRIGRVRIVHLKCDWSKCALVTHDFTWLCFSTIFNTSDKFERKTAWQPLNCLNCQKSSRYASKRARQTIIGRTTRKEGFRQTEVPWPTCRWRWYPPGGNERWNIARPLPTSFCRYPLSDHRYLPDGKMGF